MIENNLRKLCDDNSIKPNKMAKILGIKPRTFRKYYDGDQLLPLKHALELVKKYKCTLDWLYMMPDSESDNNIPEGKQKFNVDIRDIISCKDNKIIVQISDSFWQYFLARNAINSKADTEYAKNNQMKDLDSEFVPYDNSIKRHKELELDLEDFMSFINVEGENISYYSEDNNEIPKEFTEEQLERANEAFNAFCNQN